MPKSQYFRNNSSTEGGVEAENAPGGFGSLPLRDK